MKRISFSIKFTLFIFGILAFSACQKNLDKPAENTLFEKGTDYTISNNTILPLIGLYANLQNWEWEIYPTISVRGDDVNAGGDQVPMKAQDNFSYAPEDWNLNNVWQELYAHIYVAQSTMDQVAMYRAYASNKSAANQYIAEAKVIRGFELFILARNWGKVFIPKTSDPTELLSTPLSTKDEVMKHISDQMDSAILNLPDMRPNQRTDLRGGVTKYTALAIKAMANLELKNYQGVADATSQIISSGKFTLETDFYNLFKIKGKLNDENLFELQYSDFGKGAGDSYRYLWDFFGPPAWTPKVAGANGGWGFFEPSLKYIKFMLDRGETTRLQTSVIFTDNGISKIKEDPKYATLPSWISNTSPSGDVFSNTDRLMFMSGKMYLPSDQLTPGRTNYCENKNFTIIRYAEILLMHAEALTQGATSTAMTADAAVNAVRTRAGLTSLSGVTNAQVMDEKFAELAMEWGIRFYDMARLEKYSELSYEGRTFTADKVFYPYPQAQVDQLPILKQ